MNPSTEKLVAAMRAQKDPKLRKLIERAEAEEFHDYVSPHPAPIGVLVDELAKVGHYKLRLRAVNGEFDATREEGDHYFTQTEEGKASIRELGKPVADALGMPWPDD